MSEKNNHIEKARTHNPIAKLKRDIEFSVKLRDRDMYFQTTWGLFSPRRLDDGSRMLVNKIELESNHDTLDLGCGYGAIGLAIARDCPDGQVHLVDKDFIAVEYAMKNAARNHLGGTAPQQVRAAARRAAERIAKRS